MIDETPEIVWNHWTSLSLHRKGGAPLNGQSAQALEHVLRRELNVIWANSI
ncbi:MAG: hypothetical protein WD490_06980 [Opitutales bacterium]